MVKNIKDYIAFSDCISQNSKKIIVDFYAEWCGPCKMMAPVFELMSEKYNDIEFVKINVDEVEIVAQKYGIMSIPTFIFFEKGQPVKKKLGVMSESEFEDFLK